MPSFNLLTKEKLDEMLAAGPAELAYREKVTAFDFETPNRNADRACSIGVTLIEREKITDSFEILIDPETWFDSLCISIHGITPEAVEGAPLFPEVWERIRCHFEDSLVIAHNAGFDLRVLKQLFIHYGINCPDLRYADTLRISRAVFQRDVPDHKLGTLCRCCGIDLDAHHAGSDSYGCAALYLLMQQKKGDLSMFERIYRMP